MRCIHELHFKLHFSRENERIKLNEVSIPYPLNATHRFRLRLSPCEGLCLTFSLHLSSSESEESHSEDSLDDDDDEEEEEEEAEEDESDWTPVGSSMCTLSAISAISALSFCKTWQ